MKYEQSIESKLDNQIHRNINERQDEIGARSQDGHDKFEHWLYESKRLMHELRILPILYAQERKGELPKTFKYCSMSPTEKLPVENKLVCCLGQEVRSCQILLDVFKSTDEFPPELIDQAKAHVCVTHILTESAKQTIDTTEGFVQDETSRQFWQRTYSSMMEEAPVPYCDECGIECSEKDIDDSSMVGSLMRCGACLAKLGMGSDQQPSGS